jgi:hypothetical protein
MPASGITGSTFRASSEPPGRIGASHGWPGPARSADQAAGAHQAGHFNLVCFVHRGSGSM